MKRIFSLLLIVPAIFAAGCLDDWPEQPAAPAPQQTAEQPPAPQEQPADVQPENAAPQQEQLAAPNTTIVEGSAAQPEAGMVREKAERGMGKKGQGYGGGIITQPISTYFQTRDRVAFSVQIPHEMNLFKATNDRYPKDLDEFMNKIIKPAGIQLPELPDGHRYVYDPEKGELLVERPG